MSGSKKTKSIAKTKKILHANQKKNTQP